MKKTILIIALALVLGGAGARAGDIGLSYSRVPLNSEAPDQTNVGLLEYRGGLSISATDSRFGGFSSLLVSADGARMLATSDKGVWFSARLGYDDAGHLDALSSGQLAPITGPDGKPVAGRYRDAEALARGADGTVLLAFEQHHRILRYTLTDTLDTARLSATTPDLVAAPAELSEFNSNAATEGLAVLHDGGLLILTEGLDNEHADKPGWVLRTGQAHARLEYFCAARFRPTGAARLPDGDIVVVERRYTLIGGVAALLRCIPQAVIQPGGASMGQKSYAFSRRSRLIIWKASRRGAMRPAGR